MVLLTAGLDAVAEACLLLLRSAWELCCLMQAAAAAFVHGRCNGHVGKHIKIKVTIKIKVYLS